MKYFEPFMFFLNAFEKVKIRLSRKENLGKLIRVQIFYSLCVNLQVLSLSVLPSFSPSVMMDLCHSNTPLALHVQEAFVPAMIVLDLVCVATRSWEASVSLLDMAKNR